MMRLLAALCIWFSVLLAHGAAAQVPDQTWKAWEDEATMAREVIDAGAASPEALDKLRLQLETQRNAAARIAEEAAADIDNIQAELDALGPAPDAGQTEAPAAAAIRSEVTARLNAVRAKQGRAQRSVAQTRNLLQDLASLGQRNFIQRLENRSPSPLLPSTWADAGDALANLTGRLSREVDRNVMGGAMRDSVERRAPIALLALIIGLFVMFGLRAAALKALIRIAGVASARRSRLILGVGLTAARVLLTGLAAGLILFGVGTLGVLGAIGDALLRDAGQGVAIVIITYAIAAAMFSPESSGLRLFQLNNDQARGAFRATIMLAVIIAVDRALSNALDTINAPAGAWAVLTLISVVAGAIALYRLAIRLGVATPSPAEVTLTIQCYRALRRAVLAVCIVSPLLAMIGYSYAARYVFFPTVSSITAIAVAYLIFALIREAVDVFLAHDENRGDRFRLIPVFVGFLLFCLVVPVLALIWGASLLDLRAAYDAASGGLKLGDFALSPIDFLTFALVFGVGYTLTRAAQRVLSVSVLPRTSITEGGASALVSGIGYIGVFLTAVVAISATGIDLSSLAIVFGALSVGIGFGLQNIVNNFVSGIILLVERPIKVGDWIDVGGQSGYVKKVNVRSTEIETFDRASYIVPNSDLISAPVLNWTHSNKVGRVRNKVGVAYGTDPRKVEKILHEIGKAHPMVINNPAPVVYFMGFGADSLDFELRTYLSDVNWMLSVSSDLNFRINERFAEEGIEIPFAQRDLHIKNPEALLEVVDRRKEPGA